MCLLKNISQSIFFSLWILKHHQSQEFIFLGLCHCECCSQSVVGLCVATTNQILLSTKMMSTASEICTPQGLYVSLSQVSNYFNKESVQGSANAVKQFCISVISPACFLAMYVVSSALQDKQHSIVKFCQVLERAFELGMQDLWSAVVSIKGFLVYIGFLLINYNYTTVGSVCVLYGFPLTQLSHSCFPYLIVNMSFNLFP